MNFFKNFSFWLVLSGVVFVSCNSTARTGDYSSIPGYDMQHPTTINLRADLDEISGLSFYPKDTSVFAIDDEQGVLFKIYIRKDIKIEKWSFDHPGDYEDIVLFDSTFYALQSKGKITRFRFAGADSFTLENKAVPLKGKNEFETLYADPQKRKLYMICKDCKEDDGVVSAYAYDVESADFEKDVAFTIDTKEILKTLSGKEKKFKPSAAAIHPITKELYIVSSINKCIVVASTSGTVKATYPLDPHLFKQPEGITFTTEGTMLISNESANEGSANILIFKYKGARS